MTTTTQFTREAEQARKVSLQSRHATIASYSESGFEQVNMASVDALRDSQGTTGVMNVMTNVDASVFAQAFAENLYDSTNDDDFIDNLNEHLNAEVLPYQAQPTPIQLALLADNSVRFNPTNRYANSDKPTTKVKFGQMVNVEKATEAVNFSHSVELYDFNMLTAGFTSQSMERTVNNALVDLAASMTSGAVSMLVDGKLTSKIEVDKPKGKPSEQADDILDLLALNMPAAYGSELNEYTLLIPRALSAILDRARQNKGYEDLEELLGCSTMEYSGEDRGLFLLPRRFTALAFRTHTSGALFPVSLIRNPNKQAWVIEIRGCMELIASATAKDAEGVEVKLPLITQLAWKEPAKTV